ncbi:MAG: amidohydrolase family protein [Alphaproteobacteria bacterium]|nr:amidohydrolase family protein [Alphaproteobacteria bacterium]
MTETAKTFQAIDAAVNIWTPQALQHRPDWTDEFFIGKVKGKHDAAGISLETMLEQMDEAGIAYAFLIAAKSGRAGLPGCYHMPPQVVADAIAQYPDRFLGLVGIDPYQGMEGVRALEHAVRELGFIGAHLYPHWFDLPPHDAKYYPFYTKCIELDIPVQMQVGQSLIYAKNHRSRSVGRPIYLDDIACDLPELKLIGSHLGVPWHDEMIAMAWKHENVFICTDAHSPRYWPQSVRQYVNSYGQDKVIFATDFPVLRFTRTIEEIHALDLKPEVMRKFLRDNVVTIYNLTTRGIKPSAQGATHARAA